MSFFKEAGQSLGLDLIKNALSYHIINFAGEALFVEGFRRVASITENEIVLALKKQYIKISGENLTVVSLEETSLSLKGKIIAVEVQNI